MNPHGEEEFPGVPDGGVIPDHGEEPPPPDGAPAIPGEKPEAGGSVPGFMNRGDHGLGCGWTGSAGADGSGEMKRGDQGDGCG